MTIIYVGKIKKSSYLEISKNFVKRISRFEKINMIEIKDEPDPKKNNCKEIEHILKSEAQQIERYIKKSDTVISLVIEGKQLNSEQFANQLSNWNNYKRGELIFIIGGSNGLHSSIKTLSDYQLSISDMTFPHQLMRIILLEQIYRALTINSNITYHK